MEAVFGAMKNKHGGDCHVATSPRRDVRSRSAPKHFKVRTARKSRYREAYEKRHGIPKQIDTDFEEVPGIRTISDC